MSARLIGTVAAVAIGLTGCTVTGQPTTASVSKDDFTVDVHVISAECGQYAPQAPDTCLFTYNASVRWLPAALLPVGVTTVVFTVEGGEQPMSSYATLDGTWAQSYTTPEQFTVMGRTGSRLTGHATYVTVG